MDYKNIYIRETNIDDFENIITVEKGAFGRDSEADFTANILQDETATPIISLLAFHEGRAIGHILFSRGYIENMDIEQPLFHILAPLAVIPEYQKQGIGGMLIRDGHKRIRELGSNMVFVLGHIEYYPRHGFINDAQKYGYQPTFPIPEKVKDAWMFQSLKETEFPIAKGRILGCNEMNRPEHWRE